MHFKYTYFCSETMFRVKCDVNFTVYKCHQLILLHVLSEIVLGRYARTIYINVMHSYLKLYDKHLKFVSYHYSL